jgi:hypothetical protein
MTLNVLRDEDGNMMSLIKYWNNGATGGEGDNPPSPPSPPPEEDETILTILNKLRLNEAHLG